MIKQVLDSMWMAGQGPRLKTFPYLQMIVFLYSWKLHQAGWLGLIVPAAYLCAGLLRLAKFNVISLQKESVSFFVGVPTTSAAFFLIQLVLYDQWIGNSMFYHLVSPIGLLSLVALFTFLMISPVQFPTFKRIDFFSRPLYLFAAVTTFAVSLFLFVKGVPIFLFGILAYFLGGIILSTISFFRFFTAKRTNLR